MNTEIEEYIGENGQMLADYIKKDKQRLLNKLKIGNREYSDNGVTDEYHYWDTIQERAYRVGGNNISDEDYLKLAKYEEITKADPWLCVFCFFTSIFGLLYGCHLYKTNPKPAAKYIMWSVIGIIAEVMYLILDHIWG